jgi:DNA primase
VPRQLEDTVTAIKQAVDLVTLVGEYLPLHRAGSKFKALCPFHDDHNPSLEINPERQSFKCWACGAGGDIFDFVQRHERVDFPEALRMLAERAGIPLRSPRQAPAPDVPSRADLLAASAWAEAQFSAALAHATDALDYLHSRGIGPQAITRFRLGFAPDQRDWLLVRSRRDGIPARLLEQLGMITRPADGGPPRDRFRGRLIFPIHDWQGRPIAFGGRLLPSVEARWAESDFKTAKYINSPEHPLFQKRRALYATHLAREAARAAGQIAVVEGYTDVIAAHQAGLAAVVGTLGTALGDDHIRLLRRLADRVILVFDGDQAGQSAAERALEIFLGHEIDVRVLTLPPGLDPCDFLVQHGAGPFRDLLQTAADPLDFAFERAAQRFRLESAEGTRQAAEWLLGLLARIPRISRVGLELKLAKSLDTLADRLGLPIETLQRRLRDVRRPRPTPVSDPSPPPHGTDATPIDPSSLDPLDRELVRLLLTDPTLVSRVRFQISPDDLTSPPLRQILSQCYALLDDQQTPSFDVLAPRLGPAERALAASLLAGFDSQPTSNWVRTGQASDKLADNLAAYEQRRLARQLQAIRSQRLRLDPIADAERWAALRREELRLLHLQSRARRPAPASASRPDVFAAQPTAETP